MLRLGLWREGWPDFECRESNRQARFYQSAWDGSRLAARTILLHTEQSPSDTLQFVRFAGLLKPEARQVLLECSPSLAPLLRSCPGIDQVIARGTSLPPFDVSASLLSLPALLKMTPAALPVQVPYLFPDAQLVDRWRSWLDRILGFRIGIVWQGSTSYAGDRSRSLPLAEFAALAEMDGVQLISLETEHTEQLEEVANRFWVINLERQLDKETGSFLDAAAVMKELDLVITADTSLAHLAGRWVCRLGWRCPMLPIGVGCTTGTTAPGILPYGCSGKKAQ